MRDGQFRFGYFTPLYEETVAFYRDGLELPVVESWDRGREDRGTLFRAAAGLVEVLARPKSGRVAAPWDPRPPQGVFMVVEADDVGERFRRAVSLGLTIRQALTEQDWGHLSFTVEDPNGVVVYIFRPLHRHAHVPDR
jgi:catechol 2,3-dioxygenase-like lactoylglutathione lyase family enzyme